MDESDTELYVVVLNAEEQYSIWPQNTPPPSGWRCSGFAGIKTECLANIDSVWTDMRPASLRRWMAEQVQAVVAETDADGDFTEGTEPPSLITRLSNGEHRVEVESGDLDRLRAAVSRGELLVRFPDTAGGTDLMCAIDSGSSDLAAVERGAGSLRLVGELVLDGEAVRCHVALELPALVGTGHLESQLLGVEPASQPHAEESR